MTGHNNNACDRLAWAAYWLLFLIATQYFQHNLGGAGLQLSYNNTVWVGAILVIAVGAFSAIHHGQWRVPRSGWQYGALILALFLPMLWTSTGIELPIGRLLGVLGGIAFLLALAQCFKAQRDEKWLLYVLVALGACQAVLGALQLYGFEWLPIGIPSGFKFRPSGIFQQPNVFASFIVTAMAAAIYLLAKHKVPEHSLHKLLWLAPLYAVLAFGGFCTYIVMSRTGVLALIGSLLLLLAMHKKFSSSLAAGIGLLIAGEVAGALFTEGLGGGFRGTEAATSSSWRIENWTVSWHIFKDHWLFGAGLGSFELVFSEYRAELYATTGLMSLHNVDHPHNELLFWAAEGGLLPVLGILVFSVAFIWRLTKLGNQGWGYAAMLFPMALHAMTEYPFYHSAIHWLTFLVILFLVEARVGMKEVPVAMPYLAKSLAVMVLLAGTAFFASNLHTISKLVEVVRQNEVAKAGDSPLLPLLDIVNPVVFDEHISHIVMFAKFQNALKVGDGQALREFISWGWEYSRTRPRAQTYLAMLDAARALRDKDEYNRILAKGQWLYPNNERLQALRPVNEQ
ncbi:Wzy polymerase domain-containing protein [Gallaecimonas sp. GXIMD4217]|uniref:PglL family O-oligosaccharyltransferase n=1 Tax=Gallaecimonas sp. GXIMD4217 TaxID=3131927 RepID=UPI00311ADF0C